MAAFAAVLVVILVSGAVVYDRLRVIDDAKNWRVHTTDVLAALQATLDATVDQEAGLRDYVTAGRARALERYRRGGEAFTAAARTLMDLTSDNPAQQSRLRELSDLANTWRSHIAEPAIALMANRDAGEEARALAGSAAGRAATEPIRAKADEIAGVEHDLLAKRDLVQTRAFATAYAMTIVGGAASLIVATLMGVLLTRGIAVPIARMTAAMTALAKGNTSVEVPGARRPDEIGAMASAVDVFRDSMIERQRADEALRQSEDKWRAVFENNPTMYFMVDRAATILSVNPFGAEQLGYTVAELTGRSVLSVFHEEDRATAQRNAARCFDHLGRTFTWELCKCRKDGSTLWVRETGRAMLMKGAPVLLIVCEDITQRKRAESLTTRVFESAPDGICIVGRDYRYRRANPVYAKRWGVAADRIVGMHISEPLGKDAFEHVLKTNLDRCFAGEEVTFEWWSEARGRRYLTVTYSPLRSDSKEVEAALVIQRDLTDHMLASEALREAQAELAHVNRVATMGQLTASIAHEVNQPIAATVTNAQAALRWLGARPPNLDEVGEALGAIVADGGRARDVIGRIHALMKRAAPRKDSLEINAAILEVVALTRGEAVKNGVSVQTQLAEGLPPVQGDRVQLQQVILNLIVNAFEAMSASGEGPRDLLIATAPTEADGVLVTVRDSGPGLAPGSLERLFEPFFTTKPSGLGMGLSICRSIIEAHGGRLWATANTPRGASLHFTVTPYPS
jgi:PAS domain S-box-containing protein